MMRQLTVFDLDETLVHGDTSVTWRRFLQDKGVITDPEFTAKDNAMMQQYADGTLNLPEYIAFSLTPLAAIPTQQVEAWVRECVQERVMPNIFTQAKPLLKQLTEDSPDDVLIISATVTFIVKIVAEALGVKQAIGVDIATQDNAYTTEILGVPSFREGKVTRLKQWLAEHDKTAYYDHITFYTDSINDLPLCEFADEALMVNPCPLLRPIAEEKNWEILNWSVIN